MTSSNLDRYIRQMRYAPLGEEGQAKLAQSTALICGLGALGSVIANTLARAGVGHLRIVDRDFVDLSNLQRQVLYDEKDVAEGTPKAIAAAEKLRKINSSIEIEPHVADVDHQNICSLCDGVDCIVDGTDNFETRFLLDEAAEQFGIPWVYGGCIGAEGQTMTILPGETPSLMSLLPEPPPPGTTPTCDTAGILAGAVNVVASIEATEAIKILSGNRDAVSRVLLVIDLWDNRVRQVKLDGLLGEDGRPVVRTDFPWLEGRRGNHTAALCGRNAVQLCPEQATSFSLTSLADKLSEVGTVTQNPFLLRFAVEEYEITIFADGRAIVGGTDDISTARTVYSRYIGS